MTNNFRTIALTLRDYISDTYKLLEAADAVERIIPDLDGPTSYSQVSNVTHEALVTRALDSVTVMTELAASRRIVAIKHLRTITGSGLKDAKDAVEDHRVVAAASGWSSVPSWAWDTSTDETPF